jgi:hypothetical protein
LLRNILRPFEYLLERATRCRLVYDNPDLHRFPPQSCDSCAKDARSEWTRIVNTSLENL